METFFRDIELYNEAMCVEHLIPIKRKFTHAELEPALKAIREIEAANGHSISRAMMESIGSGEAK